MGVIRKAPLHTWRFHSARFSGWVTSNGINQGLRSSRPILLLLVWVLLDSDRYSDTPVVPRLRIALPHTPHFSSPTKNREAEIRKPFCRVSKEDFGPLAMRCNPDNSYAQPCAKFTLERIRLA